MSAKMIGLLVAVVVILLGLLIVMLNSKPQQTVPVATPAPVTTVAPNLDKKRGSFKKSEPGKYGYRSPD